MTPAFYDELIAAAHQPRQSSYRLVAYLRNLSPERFNECVQESEAVIREMGITFTVYSDAGNIDRAWPFDIIPRVIAGAEWDRTEMGLKQRIRALNMFIQDIYNGAKVIKDGVIPEDVVMQSKGYREACVGITPPHGVWANICGSDLVRHRDGVMYVLEDNLRVPSGWPTCWKTATSPSACCRKSSIPCRSARSAITRRTCMKCWPRCAPIWTNPRWH
ncbi:MAG: circularly permuted type 2 ATP-grasp protein [Thiolinea sp.]